MTELKWEFSWEAVVVGVMVFGIWVGLDSYYPKQDELMFKLGFGKGSARGDPGDLESVRGVRRRECDGVVLRPSPDGRVHRPRPDDRGGFLPVVPVPVHDQS